MLKRLVLGSLAGNPWVGVLSIFGGACLARALPGAGLLRIFPPVFPGHSKVHRRCVSAVELVCRAVPGTRDPGPALTLGEKMRGSSSAGPPRSSVSQPQVQIAAMHFATIDHRGRDVVFRFGHAMVKFFVRPFTEFCNKIEDKTIELGAVGVLQGCFEEASSRLQFEVASTRCFCFFGAFASLSLPLRGCFLVSSKLPPRGCLRHPDQDPITRTMSICISCCLHRRRRSQVRSLKVAVLRSNQVLKTFQFS